MSKTAGQKLFERVYDSPWDNVMIQRRERWEKAAITAFEDDPKIVSPEERVRVAFDTISRGVIPPSTQKDYAEALDIMPKFPDGYLLKCPVCGSEVVLEPFASTYGYRVACSEHDIHFFMGHKTDGQQAINAANAALWALGSRPNG